jgi:hypothetical protein
LRTVALTGADLSFGMTTAVTPGGGRAAQAGAEVVRVLHAVEDQQQRRSLRGFE